MATTVAQLLDLEGSKKDLVRFRGRVSGDEMSDKEGGSRGSHTKSRASSTTSAADVVAGVVVDAGAGNIVLLASADARVVLAVVQL